MKKPGDVANEHGDIASHRPGELIGHGRVYVGRTQLAAAKLHGWRAVGLNGDCVIVERTEEERLAWPTTED